MEHYASNIVGVVHTFNEFRIFLQKEEIWISKELSREDYYDLKWSRKF